MNNTSVDSYLRDGCGRCERFQTPSCKVHSWGAGLRALRAAALQSGLVEEMKWGVPCYTLEGKNVASISAFNDFYALSLFKGAALADPDGVLVTAGPNSRIAKLLRFEADGEAVARSAQVERYLALAIAAERAGVEVERQEAPEPMPEALAALLAGDAQLARAFAELTPGRRRSHVLFVSSAKQRATQDQRAGRCAAEILAGRGWAERGPRPATAG